MARRPTVAYVNELIATMEHIDPIEIEYNYDELSDTLFLNLVPMPQPGLSIVLESGWMVRVHRDTDSVLGLQIEHAKSRAAKRFPPLENIIRNAEAMRIVRESEPRTMANQFKELIPALVTAGDY